MGSAKPCDNAIILYMPKRKNRKARDNKGRFAKHRKKGEKPGTKVIVFTDKQKELAIRYVGNTGFWITRLAKYMSVDFKTLQRILKADPQLSKDIQSADAEFCGKTIKKAKPDFILRTKYRREFPEKVEVDVAGEIKVVKIINYGDTKK